MKKTIITIISATLITSSIFALGMELNPAKEVATEIPVETTASVVETESMIDMETVVDYEVTETGIMFNFADGTGYYFEK